MAASQITPVMQTSAGRAWPFPPGAPARNCRFASYSDAMSQPDHVPVRAMASRIAALTVVDCLFVAVAQRNYKQTMRALERTYAAVKARR